MSEPWDRVHRRYRLVEDVLADVDREGVAGLAAWGGPLEEEYGDDALGGLLTDVQRRWQRAFDARLDAVLEDGAEPRAAVAGLWRRLAAENPAARLLLDAHAAHPVLAAPVRRHRQTLLAATGVDLEDLRTPTARESQGGTHGRAHDRTRLRLRPVRARFCRGPVSTA